jgi:hypothetical protein
METLKQIHNLQRKILHEHNKTHRNSYKMQLSALKILAACEAEQAEEEKERRK